MDGPKLAPSKRLSKTFLNFNIVNFTSNSFIESFSLIGRLLFGVHDIPLLSAYVFFPTANGDSGEDFLC